MLLPRALLEAPNARTLHPSCSSVRLQVPWVPALVPWAPVQWVLAQWVLVQWVTLIRQVVVAGLLLWACLRVVHRVLQVHTVLLRQVASHHRWVADSPQVLLALLVPDSNDRCPLVGSCPRERIHRRLVAIDSSNRRHGGVQSAESQRRLSSMTLICLSVYLCTLISLLGSRDSFSLLSVNSIGSSIFVRRRLRSFPVVSSNPVLRLYP